MLSWLFGKKLKFSGSAFFIYANPRLAAQWWMDKFGATRVEVPEWDDPLPSDTTLESANGLGIMFSSRSEVQEARLGSETGRHPIIECNDIDLALFEIHDPEGNAIEIIEYV
jgi:hypothetical protein